MQRMIKSDTVKIFSVRLTHLMADKEIKKKELADFLDVSAAAIGQFKSGIATPKIDNLIKLAEYFNVSIDYLLGLTDVKTTDINIREICEYLNITEECVHQLHTNKENFLNSLIDDFSNKLKSMF